MTGFFAPSIVQKEKPVGLVPKCGACGLYTQCNSPKMEVYGEGRKRVLVVGEAPGKTEDEEGRPFIGLAGQFLRNTLEEIDIDLDKDAWTTNSLICRPPHNATPDLKQIGYCRPNLLNTIQRLQPNVVILLGKSAVSSLMPTFWKSDIGELGRWVGWRIPGPEYWICPSYHPSFLLRSNNELLNRIFKQHLEEAFNLDAPPELLEPIAIRCLYEPDQIEKAVRIMSESEWAAVDYEGNCLKPEYPQARIYSCALSNGKLTVSFPWTKDSKEIMAGFFKSDAYKIASNLKFEERWTRKVFGFGVRRWGWDTMLASHVLDNRRHICSLKFQSWVKMGVVTYNENIEPYLDSDRGHYNRIHKVAIDDLLTYGGMDAILEYRLAMRQREEMGL